MISAHRARSLFVRKPRNADEQHVADRQKSKKFLVKGRTKGARVVWDVYSLDTSPPKLAGADFAWQEEAIAFARDRSLGRMAVNFGSVRGLFRAGGGGILAPETRIEKPGGKQATVRQAKGGGLIVE